MWENNQEMGIVHKQTNGYFKHQRQPNIKIVLADNIRYEALGNIHNWENRYKQFSKIIGLHEYF